MISMSVCFRFFVLIENERDLIEIERGSSGGQFLVGAEQTLRLWPRNDFRPENSEHIHGANRMPSLSIYVGYIRVRELEARNAFLDSWQTFSSATLHRHTICVYLGCFAWLCVIRSPPQQQRRRSGANNNNNNRKRSARSFCSTPNFGVVDL